MHAGDPHSQPPAAVEIRPPSARAEAWHVLRIAALIVLATWIYLADTTGEPGRGAFDQGAGAIAGAPAADGGGVGPAAGAGFAASAAGAGSAASVGSAGGGAAAVGSSAGSAAAAAGAAAGAAVADTAAAQFSARDLMPFQKLFRDCGDDTQRMFRELQEGLLEAENRRSADGRWPSPQDLAAAGVPPFADRGAASGAGAGTAENSPGGTRAPAGAGAQGNAAGGTSALGGMTAAGATVPPDAAAGQAAGGDARRRRPAAYQWQLRRDGLTINYLGVPQAAGAALYMLVIQEPDPLAPDRTAPAAGAPIPPGDEVHQRLADGTLLHVSIWTRPAPAPVPAAALAMPAEVGWTQLLAGAGRF